MAKEIEIEFEGYWREAKKENVPSKSGIYCVYRCTHDADKKEVFLKQLIYIGESQDVNSRLANHNKLDTWKKYLKQGETLCYTFGAVPTSDRVRCEAALIFQHQPPVNTEYTGDFKYVETSIVLTGKTALLTPKFTVKPV